MIVDYNIYKMDFRQSWTVPDLEGNESLRFKHRKQSGANIKGQFGSARSERTRF